MKAWLMHSIVVAIVGSISLIGASILIALLQYSNPGEDMNALAFLGVVAIMSIAVGFATSWMAAKTPIHVDNRDALRAVETYRQWMARSSIMASEREAGAMFDVLREFALMKMSERR